MQLSGFELGEMEPYMSSHVDKSLNVCHLLSGSPLGGCYCVIAKAVKLEIWIQLRQLQEIVQKNGERN